ALRVSSDLTEKEKHCRASLINIDREQCRPKMKSNRWEIRYKNDREKPGDGASPCRIISPARAGQRGYLELELRPDVDRRRELDDRALTEERVVNWRHA